MGKLSLPCTKVQSEGVPKLVLMQNLPAHRHSQDPPADLAFDSVRSRT